MLMEWKTEEVYYIHNGSKWRMDSHSTQVDVFATFIALQVIYPIDTRLTTFLVLVDKSFSPDFYKISKR